jgi:hypothetical protein
MRAKLTGISIVTFAIFFLTGCGGGDGNSTASNTPEWMACSADSVASSSPVLLKQIQASHIAPIHHLNQLSISTADTSGIVTASAADLQSNYNTKFCQLNSTYGVTLQSPECIANIDFIKGQTGTGNFNLSANPIGDNPLGVNGILFKPIRYTTKVSLPDGMQSFNVSGGLILPTGISGNQIKGVVTYFHATALNKCKVGSDYKTNGETQLVAEVFASQGYVVVIPDYIGQGVDWKNVHPYVLYPEVSAKTAIDMLTAVAPEIRAHYKLQAGTTLKLFSAGYSEGGAYSLWFPSYLKSNPSQLNSLYQFKHAMGMEGAYNTSNVTSGFLFEDVTKEAGNAYKIQNQFITNAAKALLSADAFLSYATYQLNGIMNSVFNMSFYNLDCPAELQSFCNINGQRVNMTEAFAQRDTNVAVPVFLSALGKTSNGYTYASEEIIFSDKNSAYALISPTLFNEGWALLQTVLQAANVNLSNLANAAVSIVSLDKDSVVTPNNYDALVSSYPTKIRDAYKIPSESIKVVSPLSYLGEDKKPDYVPVDHLQGLVYEFLYALNTFNQF